MITCLFRNTHLPPSIGGSCIYDSATVHVTFSKRILLPVNSNTYLICSGATAIAPKTDLTITNDDGKTAVVAGTSTTYTIVVTNAGPNPVTGASVTDTLPAALTAATYTSIAAGGATGNTASGTGSIADTLTLPVGATVTYTLNATFSPAPGTASVANSATVTAPAGVIDSNPANNSATDTDSFSSDLAIQVLSANILAGDICSGNVADYDDSSVTAGTKSCYLVIVRNLGPNPARNITVHLAVVNGSSTLSDDDLGLFPGPLAVNGTITISNLRITIPADATGTVVATATVSATQPDINPANNTATDTDTVLPPT
jgi:uncharacterized repeat protein (TIGR01451 family)